ncbi:glycosyltransferase involved in cell wall biosynthesis [Isoptericola jiangsuensis]|uniref:D-inositol 3-phosphate glycosyltransferase n=2 Tax=Isoptericola jiangsuensis TaxID=548579 RepID=A0A2A9F1E5_9MICO|nr:glycosyltransferase involved in cell wall biosynthesis [Isoptericola jiangsuensis]
MGEISMLRAPQPPRRDVTPGSVMTGDTGTGVVAVHHHLTNSLPHTQSGYTLRTHAILTAQRAAGLRVSATTRPGYPLTIGVPTARHTDVVDEVAYQRLVPRGLPLDRRRRETESADLLAAAALSAGARLLHATTPWTTGQAAHDAADRLGLPWVYEVRGLPEETWAASHSSTADREEAARSERYALIRAKETSLALAADHVVTLSATMRDELVSRGVPGSRISVVPNAVDSTLLGLDTVTPGQARARLGLADRPLIGTVTSVVGYEGLDMVLHTVARLRAEGLDVGALVVGDGVARPGLQRLADDLGISPFVTMPGRVPRRTARTYLAALDVVLVPRRPDRVTRLVTPLKPVEAMAIGRPVVASDLPALAEVCSPLDGGRPAARLVLPGDVDGWKTAVTDLLHDEAARTALVAAGREVASGRTWERIVSRYDAVYSAALAPRSR